MKYALSLCIIAVTILAVGCQESNPTAPVAASSQQLLKPSPTIKSLELKGDVPSGGIGAMDDQVFHVTGYVAYAYTISGEGEDQMYEFTIRTQAELIPTAPGITRGSVNNNWVYQISAASKTGVVLVQRNYYVPELSTKFHVIFAIDENNIMTVQSMWLDEVRTSGTEAVK